MNSVPQRTGVLEQQKAALAARQIAQELNRRHDDEHQSDCK
jgi:hypothetical protein